jgi:putative transposase
MGILNFKHKLIEPMIYEDTANTNVILAYFENVLPKLKTSSVVIMDNASYHKSKRLQNLFEKYGHKLVFLPPYSPELNPIENIWGTIKSNLRNYYDYSVNLFDNLSYSVCKYCL